MRYAFRDRIDRFSPEAYSLPNNGEGHREEHPFFSFAFISRVNNGAQRAFVGFRLRYRRSVKFHGVIGWRCTIRYDKRVEGTGDWKENGKRKTTKGGWGERSSLEAGFEAKGGLMSVKKNKSVFGRRSGRGGGRSCPRFSARRLDKWALRRFDSINNKYLSPVEM